MNVCSEFGVVRLWLPFDASRRFGAWQQARGVVHEIYKICSSGILARDFGLRDQLCRAAVSCMANIAEGFGRNSGKDLAHFLDTARGSANEVQSLLYVALDAHYISGPEFERLNRLTDDTASLIGGLTRYLRGRTASTEPRLRRPANGVMDSSGNSMPARNTHNAEHQTPNSERTRS